MSENEYKTIKDLTQEVNEMVKYINEFPSEVKILSTKLIIGPDGRGSYSYFVSIKYEINNIQYETIREIYSNLHDTIVDVLFMIKHFYERMHKIE